MDEVSRTIRAAVHHLSGRDRRHILELRQIGSDGGPDHDAELLEWFLPVVDVYGVPTRGAAYRFMGTWAHRALGGHARHWDDLALALAEQTDFTSDEATLALGHDSDMPLSRRCEAASARRCLRIAASQLGSRCESR